MDQEKKRSEIASIAIKLFSQTGFENTSIQDIADVGKMGKGTVYHYFKTKEGILPQASNEILNEFAKSIGDAFLKLKDPVEKITELFIQSTIISKEIEEMVLVYMELRLINMRRKGYDDFIKILKICWLSSGIL